MKYHWMAGKLKKYLNLTGLSSPIRGITMETISSSQLSMSRNLPHHPSHTPLKFLKKISPSAAATSPIYREKIIRRTRQRVRARSTSPSGGRMGGRSLTTYHRLPHQL